MYSGFSAITVAPSSPVANSKARWPSAGRSP
ncbi:Uncharacterised protein [Mycobacteroides abscessus]|nr:Uncharacterised protein [Mycobacteroides abscessus]